MISSVAATLLWYSIRMKCCFASSREKTMIFAGSPARPARNRRTSVLPSDPVPPMIRSFLPSKHFIFHRPPFVIRSLIAPKLIDQLRPGWTEVAGCSLEFVSPQAPVTNKLLVRNDLDVQLVSLAKQAKEVEFRNRLTCDVVQPAKVRVFFD